MSRVRKISLYGRTSWQESMSKQEVLFLEILECPSQKEVPSRMPKKKRANLYTVDRYTSRIQILSERIVKE